MAYTAHMALTKAYRRMIDFDPDSTNLTDVRWESARDFRRFLFGFFRTIGTSAVVMKVIANTKADGSGTDVVVATKTHSTEPDAVGDQMFIEVTAEQIKQALTDGGYDPEVPVGVSAQVSFGTNTDEGVILYEFSEPRFGPREDLTADIIA